MHKKLIVQRVKGLIADRMPVKKSLTELKEDDSLVRDLGIDSLGTVELVVAIEQEFDLVVDDQDLSLDTFRSVGSVIRYIRKKLREGEAKASP